MNPENPIKTPVFQVSQLSWQANQKVILEDISFSVNAGEFVGLIGPNGAGKSSLLRCLYRKNTPSKGHIHFFNQPIIDFTRRELAQKLAVVLQEPPSHIELSVLDVMRMGLTPHKPLLSFDTEQDLQLIDTVAQQVSLEDKLTQSFNSLSGGEKQRAMIARVIVQQPQVLLMDEPTNHLDVQHQFEVLELAKKMGITVIVSIHDLNLAAAFCDRLILMNHGKIVDSGSSSDVLSQRNLADVFCVDAQVDKHPHHGGPRITYNFSHPVEAKSWLTH